MLLITITRCMGCGGMTIARDVAEGLKLELYDDQRLQEEAVKIGIEPELVKDVDEKAPGLFSRLLSRKPEAYLDLMESVIYEVARKGEGVIVGHGAPLLLRDFTCALHVRIYGSVEFRIKHLMDQQGLSRKRHAGGDVTTCPACGVGFRLVRMPNAFFRAERVDVPPDMTFLC
jgi:cytidylate kinase